MLNMKDHNFISDTIVANHHLLLLGWYHASVSTSTRCIIGIQIHREWTGCPVKRMLKNTKKEFDLHWENQVGIKQEQRKTTSWENWKLEYNKMTIKCYLFFL